MQTLKAALRRLFFLPPARSTPSQPWVLSESLHRATPSERGSVPEFQKLLAACQSLAPTILDSSLEIEQERRVPAKLITLLKQEGFFRMTMPRSWGGYELDPIEQFRVIEELSSLDASVGWCVMIGTDGGYFTGFLDQSVAREMYQDIDAITGAGVFPVGKAHAVPGGYKVSGRWRFGSGCQHADWMAAGCMEYALGVPLIHVNGLPRTRLCMVPAKSIRIHDTWTTTGLRGSGSHDWTLEDVFVPAERTFDLLRPKCYRTEPLYQLPGMFMYNFPGVALGIARRALQTFIEIARKKSLPFTLNTKMADEARIQSLVGQAITRLGAARAFFLQSLTDVWQTLRDSLPEHSDAAPFHADTAYSRLSINQRIRIRLAMVEVHDACVDLVNRIYKAAGGTALYSTCILDRLLRDVHTISQHVIVSTKVHEIAGKMTFGSAPDEPFF